MKRIIPIVCMMLSLSALSKADFISINDRDGETNLYELVNDYFGLEKEDQYGSSQQMYSGGKERITWNEDPWGTQWWSNPKYNKTKNVYHSGLGIVNTETTWTTSDSTQILGGYRQAMATHDLSIINGTDTVGSWDNIQGYDTLQAFASNDTPIWSSDRGGQGIYFELEAVYKNGTHNTSSNPDANTDGLTHMVAFDVTDLYNNNKLGQGDTPYDSVYLFGWEDLYEGADWDYNDVVFLMANISPNNPFEQPPTDALPPPMPPTDAVPPAVNATPEPATLAILGLGLAGLGLARRRKK